MRRAKAIVFLLLLLMTVNVRAASDAALSRGFNASGLYDLHEVDTVDAMNGALAMRIPLGKEYTSTGTLRYSFALHYNLHIWDYNVVSVLNQSAGAIHVVNASYGTVDRVLTTSSTVDSAVEAVPAKTFNAGLGWSVSLGDFRDEDADRTANWKYVSPDGAEHEFKKGLWGSESATQAGRFTRDGTYLRERVIPNVDGKPAVEVEFPDGTRKRFLCVADCAVNDDRPGAWLLDQISDPFGNVLHVERSSVARPAVGQAWTWTFIESTGEGDGPDPGAGKARDGYRDWRVDRGQEVRRHVMSLRVQREWDLRIEALDLAAPRNANSPAGSDRAIYAFTYANDPARSAIYRDRHNTWASKASQMTVPFNSDNKVSVSLLESVTLPSAAGTWRFSYLTADADLPDREARGSSEIGQYFVSLYSGRLKTMTMPTGGGYEYAYTGGSMSIRNTCAVRDEEDIAMAVPAVARRWALNGAGNRINPPWRYFTRTQLRVGEPCPQPREHVAGVVDPEGRANVMYYSVYMGHTVDAAGYDSRDYSLPITRMESDGPAADQRFLSSSAYQCLASSFNDDLAHDRDAFRRITSRHLRAGETVSCGTPLRSRYVRFDYDHDFCGQGVDEEPCQPANRRVASEKVIYFDDPLPAGSPHGAFASTRVDRSNFDGLGHFRTVTTSGTFWALNTPNDQEPSKTTVTGYNPGVTYNEATHASFTPPPAWILGTYDQVTTQQGAETAVVEYAFNTSTGFLTRKRVQRDAARRASDILMHYERSHRPDGSVDVSESYYGGDKASNLGTGALASLVLPGDPGYRIDRKYRFGAMESAEYKSCDRPFLTIERNTLDANTGLAMTSSNSSDELTTYQYDALRRVTEIAPQGSAENLVARRFYKYNPLGSIAGEGTSVEEQTGLAVTTPLEQSKYLYDDFGRLKHERKMMPDGSWSNQATVFDLFGRRTSLSTLHKLSDGAKGFTTYEYDFFDRVETETRADGSTAAYVYLGSRDIAETVSPVALEGGGNGTSTTRRSYDSHGRLIKVAEPSTTANPVTRYAYDAGDRLTTVTAGTQTRRYAYDNRGFLASETLPELPNVVISYGGYDPLGNVGSRTLTTPEGLSDPTRARFNLAYEYDAAMRLVRVKQGALTLKSYVYGGGVTLAAGKVVQSSRLNVIPDKNAVDREVTLTVTDTFIYDPVSGRLTKKQTAFDGAVAEATFGLTPTGRLEKLTYPALKTCDTCTAMPARPAPVESTYSQGWLTEVTGFARGITYWPNGLWRNVTHLTANGTNGAVDGQTIAANDLPRPLKLSTQFRNNADWTHGDIRYDGFGNVRAVDVNRSYGYDRVGRLVSSSEPGSQLGYDYDQHGNLLRMGTKTLDVDPATNRLLGASYDHGGNLTTLTSDGVTTAFRYDPFNLATHAHSPAFGRIFVYDARDERVGVIDYKPAGSLRERWSFRGPSAEILADFARDHTGAWSWSKDYVYRGSALLATLERKNDGSVERRHYHADHLGTPRRISDGNGNMVTTREYDPFGTERLAGGGSDKLRFTGHERDGSETIATSDDFDYMHARYYGPAFGRFLSLDPLRGGVRNPQMLNRYAYVRNSPLSATDPTGMAEFSPTKYSSKADKMVPGSGMFVWIYTDSPVAYAEKTVFGAIGHLAALGGGLVGDLSTALMLRWWNDEMQEQWIDWQIEQGAPEASVGTFVSYMFPLTARSQRAIWEGFTARQVEGLAGWGAMTVNGIYDTFIDPVIFDMLWGGPYVTFYDSTDATGDAVIYIEDIPIEREPIKEIPVPGKK